MSRLAAGATVTDDLISIASACDRPGKRAESAQSCAELSTTPPKVSFLALLTVRDDLKNCCEGLALENQCISGLASAVKSWKRS